jgi:hypothetical protein
MYLKRFGIQRRQEHQICAASADSPEEGFSNSVKSVAVEKGFYWGTNSNGVPHHDVEELLGKIETAATPAFRAMLDKGVLPQDPALPMRWPPLPEHRIALSWWIAAQILRTARQRERLWKLTGDGLELPRGLSDSNNGHLRYLVEGLAPLANILFRRPWGIGITTACLLTSDVPVQVINAQDDDNQHLAAAFWDVYLPLDPHRFLYLPGELHRGRGELTRDHLANLPGNMAEPLNQLMIETAHSHVFWHPEHDPRAHMDLGTSIRIRAAARGDGEGSRTMLSYEVIPRHFNVERRWLGHSDTQTRMETALPDRDPSNLTDLVPAIMEKLDHAERTYHSLKGTPYAESR